MAGDLAGQTAIVTGAGRGFGKAIALGLAAAGAADGLSGQYRIPEDDLDELLRQSHST